jgi:hypothetical protein
VEYEIIHFHIFFGMGFDLLFDLALAFGIRKNRLVAYWFLHHVLGCGDHSRVMV